ncbi:MAG: selenocysteine-specific translation elongation factor [Acetobacteraceae bacterium]|nr:selenocysteine-specific translation elongation factor [Acetobacteraceae bacterium]
MAGRPGFRAAPGRRPPQHGTPSSLLDGTPHAPVIVGTAGHIDHGKTALVKALTGTETDRLKEERARGVTIDLGFAYAPFDEATMVGFVDVPGHERLVHTMIAGAAGIDFALLVVAADDGPMPQTLEHLAILDLLGIARGVVALTKADIAAPARLASAETETRAVIAGTCLDGAEIIAVSARTGLGLAELRTHLSRAAADPVPRPTEGRFRLAVDRCFVLDGIGVIVTGTVLSGTVHVGDPVLVSPTGLAARVRSLHVQNRPAATGAAGDRCAMNLAGRGVSKEAIRRGDVVLDPGLHAPSDRIDATVRLLSGEPIPIGRAFPARLHHGARESGVRIVLLGDPPIAPGMTAVVQLLLDRPIAAAVRDRFVLRDVSARRTIGGGVFLDLRPPARKRRAPDRLRQHEALRKADAVAVFAALLAVPPFAWDLTAFGRDHALSAGQTDALIETLRPVLLADAGRTIAVSPARWQSFTADLLCRLGSYHKEHPDRQGLAREHLRLSVQPRLPASAFATALAMLADSGKIALDGVFVRLPSHVARLAPADEMLWGMIAPLLEGARRFRPPRVRDIADSLGEQEREIRRVLKLVARLGRVDEVAQDHFFTRATLRECVSIIVEIVHDAAEGEFTAAEFRDHVCNGRKVAIQILEFFDRHAVTLRRGDRRRLNRNVLDLF